LKKQTVHYYLGATRSAFQTFKFLMLKLKPVCFSFDSAT